ncbi:MAG: hypothetical protein CSA97_04440 [Bacteroidetes bacterium]|nr:MAG: hypothetical protein CSA97_04440 [Bacteroidota bacterium]
MAAMVLVSGAFVSCEDDDDDDVKNQSEFVGTWEAESFKAPKASNAMHKEGKFADMPAGHVDGMGLGGLMKLVLKEDMSVEFGVKMPASHKPMWKEEGEKVVISMEMPKSEGGAEHSGAQAGQAEHASNDVLMAIIMLKPELKKDGDKLVYVAKLDEMIARSKSVMGQMPKGHEAQKKMYEAAIAKMESLKGMMGEELSIYYVKK